MKRKLVLIGLMVITIASMTACGHEHTFTDANCTTPKTCTDCGVTEGTALGHAWMEASCTAPKTCSVCGEFEGVALEHIIGTEPNYQQPAACSVCGAYIGEALKAEFEERGLVCDMAWDDAMKFPSPCKTNPEMTTYGNMTVSDYKIVDAYNGQAASEGYEWRYFRVKVVYSDSNVRQYGMWGFSMAMMDYYTTEEFFENQIINYNGKEYDGYEQYTEKIKGEWNDFGTIYTQITDFYIHVPIDYDGLVFMFIDRWAADRKEETGNFEDLFSEYSKFLRLESSEQNTVAQEEVTTTETEQPITEVPASDVVLGKDKLAEQDFEYYSVLLGLSKEEIANMPFDELMDLIKEARLNSNNHSSDSNNYEEEESFNYADVVDPENTPDWLQ
ncbi:MAG: hypothetical protein IJ291_03520 [Lachnospiraceae bacterium]|nr:hypothetical protein [Lachnospiraceae bacterium]